MQRTFMHSTIPFWVTVYLTMRYASRSLGRHRVDGAFGVNARVCQPWSFRLPVCTRLSYGSCSMALNVTAVRPPEIVLNWFLHHQAGTRYIRLQGLARDLRFVPATVIASATNIQPAKKPIATKATKIKSHFCLIHFSTKFIEIVIQVFLNFLNVIL